MRQIIYTENPDDEQWRHLSSYTYAPNITRYMLSKGLEQPSEIMLETIAGSFSQAKEYFYSARTASLQIAPLLLYYGTINLLNATRCMMENSVSEITGHGMKDVIPETVNRFADVQLDIRGGDSGGLIAFSRLFESGEDLIKTKRWSLLETFGSIPDLYDVFLSCYENQTPYIIPIQRKISDGKEFHFVHQDDASVFGDEFDYFSNVYNYKDAYLRPFKSNDGKIIMRFNLDYEDVYITSYSGKKFLRLMHQKENRKIMLCAEMAILMSLYLLGIVCRYRPKIWNPFALRDSTGERSIVERFLYISRRVMPNYILNRIESKEIVFSSNYNIDISKEEHISKSEIDKLVEEKINLLLTRKLAKHDS